MERERINYLYQQYLQGKASSEELKQWEKIMDDPLLKEALGKIIDQSYYQIQEEEILELDENRSEEIYNYVISHPSDQKRVTKKLWPKILIAAAVAAIITTTGILFFNTGRPDVHSEGTIANDVAPGKQGATLTLANGKKITLAEAANGQLAEEAGVVISKAADGQISYEIKGTETEPNKLNKLSTAKGETYQLRLPDGSLVWLNAASSLTYSASLKERGLRRVKLEGEAYFQIAKDKLHPFIVESKGQEIEVLGTHFNVSAYTEDVVTKTSLLEGSIKINNSRILKPGEQVILSKSSEIKISEVDVEEAVAWKNGKFVFDYENLESVMRKLARWYDVEIIYQGEVSQKTFSGTVSRFDNISKILEKITYTNNVHFKIEGRRILVME